MMKTTSGSGPRGWRRYGLLALVMVAMVLTWLGWRHWGASEEAADDGASYFTVTEGPLTISFTESGTIKPSAREIIKSEIEGRTTILYLIPEGTLVKQGDLLVELDATGLQDAKLDHEIKVQNAEAAFIQSRENLAIVRNQAESDKAKAVLDVRFAKEDLVQYSEGEYPNALKDRESRITLAQETLQRKKDALEWSRVLFEEKYIAESEFQADELEVKKAQLDLDLARNGLDLLTRYTYRRRMAELESQVTQTEMALERVRRKSAANIVQAEADLAAKESGFRRQSDMLAKLEEQIAKARITAPRDGLVIFATSTRFSWRGNIEPLAEGQEVRQRQELIHLPTASTFLADVSIHETTLDKVQVGLPARITLDALPGAVFDGEVKSIAPLADPASVYMNPDLKVYRTEIAVSGGGALLRTGMNCQVEILVEHYDSALFVPLQCVIRRGGQPVVYVRGATGDEPRAVVLGLDNHRMVRIVEGLDVGDMVSLTPPLGQADARGVSAAFELEEDATEIVPAEGRENQASDAPESGSTGKTSDAGAPEQRAAPAATPSERRGGRRGARETGAGARNAEP